VRSAVDAFIAVAWVVFWVGWIAAALRTKATRTRAVSSAPLRVAIVVVVLLLVRSHVLHGRGATVDDPWLEAVGLVLFVAGLALAVWARVYLGRNWGTPMSEKDDPELVTTGPYRWVRHPIYSGLILAMLGTALAVTLYWFVITALLGGYFVYAATVEERIMVRRFPEVYAAYKARTRMLVPFVF
jgi:protein-S-isoprenylcysteine O-methyltransferase Ste14